MSICDGMPVIRLPRYIHEHKQAIVDIFNHERGVAYGFSGWHSHFKTDRLILQDLNLIKRQCPERICRKDVGYFAGKARSGGYDELRRFFLACMIWGWRRGGKYGQGFKNTEAAVSDPKLRQTLEESVGRINKGQIKEAYEEFDLDGCRSAFFTKFFYFVGKEYGARPLPLILDRHVASFLCRLGEMEGLDYLSEFVRTSPEGEVRRWSSGYLRYVVSVNDWADAIGCSPDHIEYFMYRKDKECEQMEDREGIPGNGLIYEPDGAHCFYCYELLASPPFCGVEIREKARKHVCNSPRRRSLFL